MGSVQRGFKLNESDGLKYFTVPSFEAAGGIVCAVSARDGGVSPAPFDSLNFSRKRENNEDNFIENMKRFARAVGFDYNDAIAINYGHSDKVYMAGRSDAGRGIIRENLPEICDGLYTDCAYLPLITLHADCAPLFFYDPVRRAVCSCHAGWKGITKHINVKAVESLVSIGCRTEDILAAVGPAISVTNYEVSPELGYLFKTELGEDTIVIRNGSTCANLEQACVNDMLKSGLRPENITVSGLCTYERKDLFFSHRRDRGKTGAMAAVMQLNC